MARERAYNTCKNHGSCTHVRVFVTNCNHAREVPRTPRLERHGRSPSSHIHKVISEGKQPASQTSLAIQEKTRVNRWRIRAGGGSAGTAPHTSLPTVPSSSHWIQVPVSAPAPAAAPLLGVDVVTEGHGLGARIAVCTALPHAHQTVMT